MHAFRTYIFAKAYTRCIAIWLRELTYLQTLVWTSVMNDSRRVYKMHVCLTALRPHTQTTNVQMCIYNDRQKKRIGLQCFSNLTGNA